MREAAGELALDPVEADWVDEHALGDARALAPELAEGLLAGRPELQGGAPTSAVYGTERGHHGLHEIVDLVLDRCRVAGGEAGRSQLRVREAGAELALLRVEAVPRGGRAEERRLLMTLELAQRFLRRRLQLRRGADARRQGGRVAAGGEEGE